MNQQMNQVQEPWIIYDTIRIGKNVPSAYPGMFPSWQFVADSAAIPFFNVRNTSVGEAYTNIESEQKFPWRFDLYSVGIRMTQPIADIARSLVEGANINQVTIGNTIEKIIQDHCWV